MAESVCTRDREIKKGRRGLNANTDIPDKLHWPASASCGSNLPLRSERFIDNSSHTQTNTPPYLFLLAVSRPADHPVGGVGVFINPNNTHRKHVHIQTLSFCINLMSGKHLTLHSESLCCSHAQNCPLAQRWTCKYFPVRLGDKSDGRLRPFVDRGRKGSCG